MDAVTEGHALVIGPHNDCERLFVSGIDIKFPAVVSVRNLGPLAIYGAPAFIMLPESTDAGYLEPVKHRLPDLKAETGGLDNHLAAPCDAVFYPSGIILDRENPFPVG